MDPRKYEGGGFFIDPETLAPIDVDWMRMEFDRHWELINFFNAVESGFISISLTEFNMFPATLMPAWREYKHTILLHKKSQNPHGQRPRA